MHQLDIKVVDVNTACSSIQKGETLYDTVRTLEALGMDGVVIRHPQDQYFKALEKSRFRSLTAGTVKAIIRRKVYWI